MAQNDGASLPWPRNARMAVSIQPPMITPTQAAEPSHALQNVSRSPEAQSESAAMLVVLPDSVCSVLPTTRSTVNSSCESVVPAFVVSDSQP